MSRGSNLIVFFIALICLTTINATLAADNDKSGDEAQEQHTETSQDSPLPKVPWFKRLLHKTSFWKLQYYFVAQNTRNCDLFYGLIQDNPLIGRASVTFAFPNGCDCHGVAQVTHYPLGGPTAGQRGYVKAKCSDGRLLKGHFVTTSLTTGNGMVADTLGNEYQFTFGHTAEQSIQTVNELRNKLHCPECTAEDIELKVQARIIKAY